MEIIEPAKASAFLQLSSIEMRALSTMLFDARNGMDEQSFVERFRITKKYAGELQDKLTEAYRLVDERHA